MGKLLIECKKVKNSLTNILRAFHGDEIADISFGLLEF